MRKTIYTYEYKKMVTSVALIFVFLTLVVKSAICLSYHYEIPEGYEQTYEKMINLYKADKLETYMLQLEGDSITVADVIAYDDLMEHVSVRENRLSTQVNAQSAVEYDFGNPIDFAENKNLYARFPVPEITNPIRWDLFQRLQFLNFVPLILIIMFTNCIIGEKENDMLPLLKSSFYGFKTILYIKLKLAILISLVVFHLLFITDIVCSGVMKVENEQNAVNIFADALLDIRCNDVLFHVYLGGVLFTIFFTLLVISTSYVAKSMFESIAFITTFYVISLSCSFVFKDSSKFLSFFHGNIMNVMNQTAVLNMGGECYVYYFTIYEVLYVALSIVMLVFILGRGGCHE